MKSKHSLLHPPPKKKSNVTNPVKREAAVLYPATYLVTGLSMRWHLVTET
jgi:hypothetical protein